MGKPYPPHFQFTLDCLIDQKDMDNSSNKTVEEAKMGTTDLLFFCLFLVPFVLTFTDRQYTDTNVNAHIENVVDEVST